MGFLEIILALCDIGTLTGAWRMWLPIFGGGFVAYFILSLLGTSILPICFATILFAICSIIGVIWQLSAKDGD